MERMIKAPSLMTSRDARLRQTMVAKSVPAVGGVSVSQSAGERPVSVEERETVPSRPKPGAVFSEVAKPSEGPPC